MEKREADKSLKEAEFYLAALLNHLKQLEFKLNQSENPNRVGRQEQEWGELILRAERLISRLKQMCLSGNVNNSLVNDAKALVSELENRSDLHTIDRSVQ